MCREPNIAASHMWRFVDVEQRGFTRWRWQQLNYRGTVVAASERTFETLSECIRDAQANGYIEPEKRDGSAG